MRDARDPATLDLFAGPLATSTARIIRQTAELKRDVGMARSQSGAGDEWMDEALTILRRFLASRATAQPFLVEDVRTFAAVHRFTSPKPKAWGPVIKRAERLGLVRADGYAPANSSNRSPKVTWLARSQPPQAS